MAKAMGGDERNPEPGLELLKKVAANTLTTYSSIAHMNNLLTRGEIAAGPYYSGRVWHLRQQGAENVTMVAPKEGVLMIPYMLVVPKGAKRLEDTKKFLDFVSRAEPQLRGSILGGYLPLNSNAVLPPEAEEQMGMTFKELMEAFISPTGSTSPNRNAIASTCSNSSSALSNNGLPRHGDVARPSIKTRTLPRLRNSATMSPVIDAPLPVETFIDALSRMNPQGRRDALEGRSSQETSALFSIRRRRRRAGVTR
ncbi:extracellular solute-binding protein [Neoaquamicrobium sediminum]|uniref:extracellular solute-binding protein n=1 Tax=Neoaquamicrobium sediminum TaxID=1849104 RepID=UPI001564B87D|nr:extracellular solute-binding protein [Mesorhizobium sediminum]NRC56892.1 extracellular solute-binding protein [Mesorhizobium sediminum]